MQKKVSSPLQIPVSPPRTLDSVTLVLNEDNYQKSVSEFETVMRDLSSTGVSWTAKFKTKLLNLTAQV